jgi:hypothetical protein
MELAIGHCRHAPGRRHAQIWLAAPFENVSRFCRCVVEIFQRGVLTYVELQRSLDLCNRQSGAARRGSAPQSGNIDLATRRLDVLVKRVPGASRGCALRRPSPPLRGGRGMDAAPTSNRR